MHVAFLPEPSVLLTVIVAVPAFLAVTNPPFTVATEELLLFQVTFLFMFLFGVNEQLSLAVFVSSSVKLDLLNVSFLIGLITFILMDAFFFLFFNEITVIFALPAFIPLTTPFLSLLRF